VRSKRPSKNPPRSAHNAGMTHDTHAWYKLKQDSTRVVL